jgi:hypothetical protein
MSGNYYLVARDVNTNDFKMIRGFDTLEQVDLYTTKCHSSRDLGREIWKNGIVPSQELDFFILKERSDKKSVKTMDVLYSDSKEIRNIALSKSGESVDNLVEHFYHKLTSSLGFYSLVAQTTNIKKMYNKCVASQDYIEKTRLKSKDENGNYVEYPAFRKMVEALSRYEEKKKKKDKLDGKLLNRLVIERSLLQRLNNNENQVSLFDYIDTLESKIDEDRLLETIDLIDRVPNGLIYLKQGAAHISNNLYTVNENLERLDSLLDQELGYELEAYLDNKSKLDITTDIDELAKYRELVKKGKLRIVDILSSNPKVLNDTYRLMNIVNRNQTKLLGDKYEYRKY